MFKKKQPEGEKGHKAAEQTRDTVNEVRNQGEAARKDVNAFADNLVGGNKEHGGTEIHSDAQKVRDQVQDAADSAQKKVEEVTDKGKGGNEKKGWFGGPKEGKKDRKSWFGGSKDGKKESGGLFGGKSDKK